MERLKDWRYAALIVGLILLAWLVMDFNSRMAKLQSLTREREYVVARYESVVATKSALETEVAKAGSDQAVIDWAYEEGQMVREGDIAVVPLAGEGAQPTAAPRPTATQPATSNLDSWIALFWGP